MKKEIYIISIKRRIALPIDIWFMIAVHKTFFPPEFTVKLGKKRPLPLSDIDCWPPPEQTKIDI